MGLLEKEDAQKCSWTRRDWLENVGPLSVGCRRPPFSGHKMDSSIRG